MDRLDILLLNLFDRNEVHRGSARSLDYRLGIILVRLDERLHELWANQLDAMTTSLEYARPIISTST